MLLEFYGEDCPHCIKMKPFIEKLEKEEGLKFDKYEIWHNEENSRKMDEYDVGLCGGVPFFYNTENKTFVCGSTDYESFKKWALGQN